MQRIKLKATNLKSLLPEKINKVETIKKILIENKQ